MALSNFIDDADGGMTVWNSTFDSNPVYETVAAARKLMRAGVDVPLPDGYTEDVLDTVAWNTGHLDRSVRVDARQLREIKQIARTLWSQYRDQVKKSDMDIIVQLIRGKPASEDFDTTGRHTKP